MASRKKAKKTPAVRYLRYELTNSGDAGTETSHYIDLAADISAVNRRLYRQGRTYHVRRVTVVSTNTVVPPAPTAGFISISVAPDSWVSRGAWKRGLKTFTLMNKEATRNLTNDISGKWADFKVYLSNDHYAGTKLVPKDNGGNAVSAGEWNYSEYVSPDGTTSDDTFRIHLLGDHVGSVGAWDSVGLVDSYANTRATIDFDQPNVPGVASDDPLLNVFDYGTTVDEVIDKLEAENDNPPYDIDDYCGTNGNMPKPIVAVQGAISLGATTLGGFEALCGLIEIEATSPIASDVYSVLVELAPGNYRGIHSESI